ncbi:phage holin family protein [Nocardia thraciensis]
MKTATCGKGHGADRNARIGGVRIPVEQALRHSAARPGPRLRRLRSYLFAELRRIGLAAVLLGFALVATVYGSVYLTAGLAELSDRWMPHWTSPLIAPRRC